MRFVAAFLLFTAGLAMGAEQRTIAELKQRAMAARPSEQPKLFLDIAERQLKTVDDAYRGGYIEQGHAALEDVAAYCEQAGVAATTTRKYLKQTEIRIRDMSRRLEALRQLLSFDDREPLARAIARMEKVRSDLLNAMFGLQS
jgi:hypothetical protein